MTGKTQTLSVCPDKSDIKVYIVSYQNASFAETQEIRQHQVDSLGINDHTVRDACQLCDPVGDGHLGIYKL